MEGADAASQGSVEPYRGPIMFLSAECIQSIIELWLNDNAIAPEHHVSYQWMYDRSERPIGVNIWHTELLESISD